MINRNEHLKIMSRQGKTFYFAARWLCPDIRNQVAIAYQFCRMVDDIADQTTDPQIRDQSLGSIYDSISARSPSHSGCVPILELITTFPEIQEPLLSLISMCRNDVPGRTIESETELYNYAQGVAGTVGLLMYPILGGKLAEGRQAAAILGVAMQYSNIARDVVHDLSEDRQYLPLEWLHHHHLRDLLHPELSKNLYISAQEKEQIIIKAVERLLRLADDYYDQGLEGLVFLKPRNRFAIRVAARCYQAIGKRVLTTNYKISPERAVVPFIEKCLITLRQGRWITEDLLGPHKEFI